uniref:Exocyst subunit Exo70 family protein n=1 Tax=Aegilops tauschii TaxID=37682 RepID=N1R2F0_AEGTA
MAERLGSVPEESTTGFTAPFRPPNTYRDRIWSVPVLGAPTLWTISPLSQSGHSGSSYSSSGASNSWQSNNSASSGGTARALADKDELRKIAHQMVIDGYAKRMVEEFVAAAPEKFGGSPDHPLKNWFSELDVDWVLQIDDEQGLRGLLRDKPATTQDLVQKWIRALTVIVASITELVFAFHWNWMPSVALFGKASITEMLGVVDVIVTVLEGERLQAVLDMFTCVCGASHMFTAVMVSREGQGIFNEIGGLLERLRNRLVASTLEEVRTLVEEDDSWAIEIPRGGGEVHKNTRFTMDCMLSMINAQTSTRHFAPSHNSENHIGGLIDGTIDYLNGLLFTKSESCSDQSLRYLFLLNNSYFVAHVVYESSGSFIPDVPWDLTLKLTPECKKYMDSYLNVSWGPVLSCIPKLRSPGLIHRLINTPSLAKFESAFHKTYQAQKFWKVPDPKLRDVLRRAITERVISGYRDYLEEHPELEKHVGRESSSPDGLEEMLGELFEG